MVKKIYADNAATTIMSQTAIETMVRYLSTDYGNASQPYSFSRSAKEALKKASSRKSVNSNYKVIWDELENSTTR